MPNLSSAASVQRILTESYFDDIRIALDTCNPASVAEIRQEFGQLKKQAMTEGLTDSDWNKLGVIAGLLWYKLDALIQAMRDSNERLKEIAAKK